MTDFWDFVLGNTGPNTGSIMYTFIDVAGAQNALFIRLGEGNA